MTVLFTEKFPFKHAEKDILPSQNLYIASLKPKTWPAGSQSIAADILCQCVLLKMIFLFTQFLFPHTPQVRDLAVVEWVTQVVLVIE